MKSDSPLFDRIRVKPDKDRRLRAQCPACEWPNCKAPATHRAPKGRLREREYWRFCLEHVREYNHAYNFFAGMSAEDIARYQKEAVIGHRPTWKMGMNGGRPTSRSHSSRLHPDFGGADDPFGVFRELGGLAGARRSMRSASRRTPRPKRSRPASRHWSSGIIPMPMAAIAPRKIGCARSSRPTIISSRSASAEAATSGPLPRRRAAT